MIQRKYFYPIQKAYIQAAVVARVIYAQAGPTASLQQYKLVASVIFNRLNRRQFGNLKTLRQVVKAKNAFSCTTGTDGNQNYKNFSIMLNEKTKQCFKLAFQMTCHTHFKDNPSFQFKNKPDFIQPNIVYFLTKGTPVPNSWYKWFNVIQVCDNKQNLLDYFKIQKKKS